MKDIEKVIIEFEVSWGLGQFEEALKIYMDNDRPYWLGGAVATYLEDQGKYRESINEWTHFIDGLLLRGEKAETLLRYQRAIFSVGVWFSDNDKSSAVKYLSAYLRIAQRASDEKTPYRMKAVQILSALQRSDLRR